VPRAVRVVLTGLAIAAVVPSLWLNVWHGHPYRPAFFTQGTYKTCLKPDDNVLMLPFPKRTDAMLWHAETKFAFRMANGFVGPGAPEGVPGRRLVRRYSRRGVPTDLRPLLAWARRQGVTKIVFAGEDARAWARLLPRPERVQRLGGVYLVDVRSGRACRPAG
jgi:hypothetical protein